jgi:MFS family permease
MNRPPFAVGSPEKASSLRVLWGIPFIYLLMITGEFLALTKIALLLTERGASGLAVGIMASSFWGGIMAASTQASRIVERYGHAPSFIAAAVVSALAFGSLAPHAWYPGWLAGVATMGLAGGVIWVSGEAWLAEIAPAERRGFFVGMFETSVGIGMVSGPALVPLVQSAHLAPLAVAFALTALAALASAVLLRGQSAIAAPNSNPAALRGDLQWRTVAQPLAAIAVVSGVLEAGSDALLPSVSLRLGFGVDSAAWFGAVIGAGSALLPTPAGLLADRLGMRRVLLLAWSALVFATLLLAAVSFGGAQRATALLWPVGFVLGGMGAAIYTLVVIELGHRLTGAGLIRAMAVLVTAYTAGTSIGPVVGGALFDIGGLPALATGLGVSSIAGWILTRWRVPAAVGGSVSVAVSCPG